MDWLAICLELPQRFLPWGSTIGGGIQSARDRFLMFRAKVGRRLVLGLWLGFRSRRGLWLFLDSVDSGMARVLESLDTRRLDSFFLTTSLDTIEVCVIDEFPGILNVLNPRVNTSNEIRVYLPYVR